MLRLTTRRGPSAPQHSRRARGVVLLVLIAVVLALLAAGAALCLAAVATYGAA